MRCELPPPAAPPYSSSVAFEHRRKLKGRNPAPTFTQCGGFPLGAEGPGPSSALVHLRKRLSSSTVHVILGGYAPFRPAAVRNKKLTWKWRTDTTPCATQVRFIY